MQYLIKLLENNKYDIFFAELPTFIGKISEKQRQELLVDIMDYYYDHNHFSEFQNAFDLIIGDKLNPNFNIDHWAPSFLSLVVLRWPVIELFDYFIKKGANVNFISDTLAFEKAEDLEFEEKHLLFGQYQTVLDFAQIKLDDKLSCDYNYGLPESEPEQSCNEVNNNETVTINKAEYLELQEQSWYLKDLVHTSNLIDYLKTIGGKTFEELSAK